MFFFPNMGYKIRLSFLTFTLNNYASYSSTVKKYASIFRMSHLPFQERKKQRVLLTQEVGPGYSCDGRNLETMRSPSTDRCQDLWQLLLTEYLWKAGGLIVKA